MELAKFAIQYLGAPSVVLAAAAWLCREIVKQSLRIQGDRFKSSLEHKSALAIEQVRQEAHKQLEAARHAFSLDLERQKSRFVRLQDERVAPLLILYSAVSGMALRARNLQTILESLPDSDVTSDVEQLEALFGPAEKAYLQSLLFLPEEIAAAVEKLISGIRDAELRHYIELTHQSQDPVAARAQLKHGLKGDFDKQTRSLARQLRQLLGVESIESLSANANVAG
ncbi:MAG: hypothetical protein HYR72_13115 [Deltaproteobacteria bacterium]|nr:hypothetical protein [Deltaproteobacteria bacterium]MBI3386851.1 hypothetical protein [Deltaproteobacteria bacterium]